MTNREKDKDMARPGTPSRRRRVFTRPTLSGALLLGAFVLAFGFAALAVYQWAYTTALALPVARQVSPPSIELPAPVALETQDSGPVSGLQPVIPQTTNVEQPPIAQETGAGNRITFLLLGVDQRPDDPSPPRTDNMIVLTVDPETNQAGMISLPRDLFVPIPEFSYSGKINTAYTIGELNKYPGGGGALAKKTVSEFLGYPIDYYVRIDFDGFVEAIDAIGGIDVVVPKTIHDEEYPTIDYGYQTFHIEAGPQHLDGETALKYVRTRHADDDFQRSRRQQQVLVAIKDRLTANKLLTPVRLLELVRALSSSVQHDVPTTQLPGMLSMASRLQVDQVEQMVLDNRYAQIDANSRFGWI